MLGADVAPVGKEVDPTTERAVGPGEAFAYAGEADVEGEDDVPYGLCLLTPICQGLPTCRILIHWVYMIRTLIFADAR